MELFRALAVLVEPPAEETSRVAESLGLGASPSPDEYTEVFVFQLYPYASVYVGAEGMLGGEARDRVAGFWRALGQTPPAEPDHVSVLLALYARLCEFEQTEDDAQRRESWRRARKSFLWEHVLSWLPFYLDKLDDLAPPFYRQWGTILKEALIEEARLLGAQTTLPLHLREAPPTVVDPRDERDGATKEFLTSLLCPVRSGIILTRADLTRASRKLGLGARAGERRFALESLLSQDAPAGVLAWLAEEARVWVQRQRQHARALGGVAKFWEERAAATSALLEELEQAASEEVATPVADVV